LAPPLGLFVVFDFREAPPHTPPHTTGELFPAAPLSSLEHVRTLTFHPALLPCLEFFVLLLFCLQKGSGASGIGSCLDIFF
jgi:hypothetical protein